MCLCVVFLKTGLLDVGLQEQQARMPPFLGTRIHIAFSRLGRASVSCWSVSAHPLLAEFLKTICFLTVEIFMFVVETLENENIQKM